MPIALEVEHLIAASPEAAFALALDPRRFPAMFRGFGPIPAVERITLHAPPAVGSTRDLENSDGTRLQERITALEPARRHAYALTGMRPPFGWLVRLGEADWRFTPHPQGVHVTWRYRFTLTHALAWPLAWPLLHGCMRTAMRRCLHAMAAALQPGTEAELSA